MLLNMSRILPTTIILAVILSSTAAFSATEGVTAATKPAASYAANAQRIAAMQKQLLELTQKTIEMHRQLEAIQQAQKQEQQLQQNVASKQQAEDAAKVEPAAGK